MEITACKTDAKLMYLSSQKYIGIYGHLYDVPKVLNYMYLKLAIFEKINLIKIIINYQ